MNLIKIVTNLFKSKKQIENEKIVKEFVDNFIHLCKTDKNRELKAGFEKTTKMIENAKIIN